MRNQELGLLQMFDAIMSERSVTRAAQRLSTTQPAVSNAISRMRDVWKDPLFVKSGRNIEPTAFAFSLWRQIKVPLAQLSEAVNLESFDPSKTRREFKVSLSDFVVDIVWPPLLSYLEREAPNIAVYAMPHSVDSSGKALKEAQIDLMVGPKVGLDKSFKSSFLFEDNLVLVMANDHPLSTHQDISLDDYVQQRHLLVTNDHQVGGLIDNELEKHRLSRNVVSTVNHFAAVPSILRQSDLIASVPNAVAGTCAFRNGLTLRRHPLSLSAFPIHLIWHTRNDTDEGMKWFRDTFQRILCQSFSDCKQKCKQDVESSPQLKVISR